MKRVLIVGSQHGNELLGERMFTYIKNNLKDPKLSVEYLLANPRARKRNVRLVESDMNRSYGLGEETYEQRRARRILRRLRNHTYDIVIDAHTTTVDQPACVIVPYINDDNRAFLASSHVTNIVVMRHKFVHQSLIGNLPRTISLEVSEVQLDTLLLQTLLNDLLDYAHGKERYPEKDVFVVRDLVSRDALSPESIAQLRNFELADTGFYPVLVGEEAYRTYTQYIGFKAAERTQANLRDKQVSF